jgi:hypothetical protein
MGKFFRCCFFLLQYFCILRVSAGGLIHSSPVTTKPKITEPNPIAAPKTYLCGCVTWNLAERSPSDADMTFIKNMRSCDMLAIGVQVYRIEICQCSE